MPPLRAYVYFDGFNFYNGCLKNPRRPPQWSQCKWLDLEKYCDLILGAYDVQRVRYFTAEVKSLPNDPAAPERQQTYLRALESLSRVSVHRGQFYVHPKWRYLARPSGNKHKLPLETARVIIPEEKGSDVNLASYLLTDGFLDLYDTAVVISNDSDLATPIEIVTTTIGKPVILLNPHLTLAFHLSGIQGVLYREMRLGPLTASQFPHKFADEHGDIEKPSSWQFPIYPSSASNPHYPQNSRAVRT